MSYRLMRASSSPPREPPPERPINIAIYSFAQGVSSIGTWMQKAGLGWLTWQLTHSAAWVGALSMTDVLTAIWVGPLAGAVADRESPYRVILVTQSMLTLHAICLGLLVWSHAANIWILWAFCMFESTVQGFNQPVRMTIIGLIAGRERLPQAIASNSIANNLARSIGPAIAGIVMLKSPAPTVYLANAVSYLAMIGAILYLRPWTDRPAHGVRVALLSDITAGFRYIVGHREIATLFLLATCFSLLARPFTELLPAIAGGVFKGGPQTLSMLMSAQGIGALIGAGILLNRRGSRHIIKTTFAAGIAVTVCLVAFSASVDLRVALVAIGLAGAFHVACNIGMQSIAQTYAAEAYKGRVLALYGLIFRAGPSLGAFILGLASEWFGLRLLLALAATLSGILILWIGANARRIYAPALAAAE
jgi:predicted MFS family arabinose efflux permease